MLDMVLPRVCVVCGHALLPCEKHICMLCKEDIPRTSFSCLRRNPMSEMFNALLQPRESEPYVLATALFHYRSDSPFSSLTKALKYHGNVPAGRYFSEMLAAEMADSELFRGIDLVVPVPLHWHRQWKRGYNQAEVIARVLSERLGASCEPKMLRRTRRTKSQATLHLEERPGNTAGAFALSPRGIRTLLEGRYRHILLVDDVFTSGSTLLDCHRALRAAAGSEVRISLATLGYAGK